MSVSNGMFTKKQQAQMQLAHGNEVVRHKSKKEYILTTTGGIVACAVVFCLFFLVAGLSL